MSCKESNKEGETVQKLFYCTCQFNTGKDGCELDTFLPLSAVPCRIKHSQYFALINFNQKLAKQFFPPSDSPLRLLSNIGFLHGDKSTPHMCQCVRNSLVLY